MSLIQPNKTPPKLIPEQLMNDLYLPDLLFHLRMRVGLSQDDVAALMNTVARTNTLTRTEVSRWERGLRSPSAYWMGYLSIVLGSPYELLAAATRIAQRSNSYRTLISTITPVTIEALRNASNEWHEKNDLRIGVLLTSEQIEELREACTAAMTKVRERLVVDLEQNLPNWRSILLEGNRFINEDNPDGV